MNKKKTPVSSVVFYIIGIILLIVSLFMLWTAVSYTKAYLQSYDASFKDMWTNSVQYIITQFLPYCGMGVICLGLGRAISGSAGAKTADNEEEEEGLAADLKAAAKAKAAEKKEADAAAMIDDLARRIDTNREVLSIKIEEKEKRDSYRIKELEKKVDGFLEDIIYINQPLEDLVYKQAAGIDEEPAAEAAYAEEEESAETAEAAAPGAVPQFFSVAKTMTMPACPVIEAVAEAAEEVKAPGAVPQFFRVAKTMTMPACPVIEAAAYAEEEETAEAAEAAAPGAVPQFFRVAKTMTMPACPAVEAAAEAAEAKAPGAVPPVFRVARTMTMTV